MIRGLALGAGLLALLAPAAHALPRLPGCTPTTVGGVRALRCGPASGKRAVVLLHGCGGFSTFDDRLAKTLPDAGITTFDLDYFARTPPPGKRGFCSVWNRPAQLFAIWQDETAAAAQAVRKHFAHVGAVGWSLGAGVAIGTAENRGSFAALVAFSALAYPASLADVARLPPSIFLDGGSRDIVKPANARRLYAAARMAGVPAELYVYGDGTHQWPGAQGAAGIARAEAFLARYL